MQPRLTMMLFQHIEINDRRDALFPEPSGASASSVRRMVSASS